MNILTISRKMRSLALIVAAVVSVVVVQVSATRPVHADSTCSTGSFCLWQHARYGGWKLSYYNPGIGCHTLPSGYWDQASSVQNRTSHIITAYTLQTCTGIGWNIVVNQGGGIGWPFNDEMRSFYVNP